MNLIGVILLGLPLVLVSGNAAMSEQKLQAFPPGVDSQLKTYVYRLLDPRTGETFYVGKGTGNRVFAHIRAEIDDDDADEKLNRIREIQLAGFEVAHVIHRHGLDDDTAYEVEAALIDAYPGLANAVGGLGAATVVRCISRKLSRNTGLRKRSSPTQRKRY
jgi:uncharacterized protein